MNDLLTDNLLTKTFPGMGEAIELLDRLILTGENYYSPKADQDYMSASQLRHFLDCEAMALAELNGDYVREETTALLVGGYVDAYFSRTLDEYVAKHPQIYTNRGDLRADFRQAQDIIAFIENDPLMMAMLQGDLQTIIAGDIMGVPFKGKLDVLLDAVQCRQIANEFPEMAEHLLMADGAIVDMKILRDLEPIYVPGAGRVSFVQAWRYDLQLACYQAIYGHQLPCFLLVATKERQPDKALIYLPQYMLDSALKAVEDLIPRFHHLKTHPEEAISCGRCAWCRSQKKLTGAIDADDLEGAVL